MLKCAIYLLRLLYLYLPTSLSTVEQIRRVNGLKRVVPTRTGRETMVHESYNIGELHRYLHADEEQFCRIFFVLKA